MSDVPPTGDQHGWTAPPSYQANQPPPGWSPPRSDAGRQPSNGLGVAALVLGILALVTCWVPFLGLGLAVLALVLGILGLRKANRGEATNRGMSITGVVLGGIALLIGLLSTVAAVALLLSDDFRGLTDCLAAADTDEDRVNCQELFQQNVEE